MPILRTQRRGEAAGPDRRFRSVIAVPLMLSSGEVFGVLGALHPLPRRGGSEELDRLDQLGRLVANEFEHTELIVQLRREHELAERRRRISEGLQESIELLDSGISLSELLGTVAGNATAALGAGAVGIYFLSDDGGSLHLAASAGLDAALAARLAWPIGLGPTGAALAQHDCFLASCDETVDELASQRQPDDELLLAASALAARFGFELAVPVLYGGSAVGSISFWYETSPEPLRDHLVLGRSLADQVGLALAHHRLQQQAAMLAGQTDRNRLARDLHDGATQTLFAASLLADTLPAILAPDPAQASEAAQEIGRLCRGSLIEMRSLLLELRSESLEGMSLAEILSQLCAAFEARSMIQATLQAQAPPPVAVAVKRGVFRVAQEALGNIVKHARATEATVTMAPYGGGGLVLTISDNGRGFDPPSIRPGHWGLKLMQERASDIGARLEVSSRPGGGATVQLQWDGPEGPAATDHHRDGGAAFRLPG